MTDTIGHITVYVDSFLKRDGDVSLGGRFQTRLEMNSLIELFRKAPEGCVIRTVLGGHQVGIDLTEENLNTQYCLFDSELLIDGWYLLRRLRYNPPQGDTTFYRWTANLFYLGTDGYYQRAYDLQDLEEETNDWGI